MMVLATVTLAAVSCGPKKPKEEKPKVLVAYYSQTSNTQKVATEIATRLDADMMEIVPVEPYDGDFDATIERGKRELDEGILPEIQPLTANVADYDIIFIGYPIWFGTYAPPIATFLNQVDLSGKKIVPFCTFGSGGLESSIKLLEGEYIPLGDFEEQHEVSEEEIAIFNAATGDYPMMHAEAESVGERPIPGGKEFLFIAKDLPREDMPDMPPMGMMKVYVTVLDGEAPVFTRVVR